VEECPVDVVSVMVDAYPVSRLIGDEVAVGCDGKFRDAVGVDCAPERADMDRDGVVVDVGAVEQGVKDHDVAGKGDGQLAAYGQNGIAARVGDDPPQEGGGNDGDDESPFDPFPRRAQVLGAGWVLRRQVIGCGSGRLAPGLRGPWLREREWFGGHGHLSVRGWTLAT